MYSKPRSVLGKNDENKKTMIKIKLKINLLFNDQYICVGGDFIELVNSDNRRGGAEWRSCEQDTSSPIILQRGSVDPVEWL